jgi:hypothetical protein
MHPPTWVKWLRQDRFVFVGWSGLIPLPDAFMGPSFISSDEPVGRTAMLKLGNQKSVGGLSQHHVES